MYSEFVSRKTNLQGTWSWVEHNIGRKSYFGQEDSTNVQGFVKRGNPTCKSTTKIG